MDLKEFGNSINKIINERLTSPFYGTLIVSWLIINWKIIYLTIFVDSSEIRGTKIDFIVSNYSESSRIIWYPLLTTILIITIVPFITYLAYWASLIFIDLRRKLKNKIEKNQQLTVEESAQIRLEIQNQKVRLIELLKDKDIEIESLKLQIEELSKSLIEQNKTTNKIDKKSSNTQNSKSTLEIIQDQNKKEEEKVLFEKLFKDTKIFTELKSVIHGIESYGNANYFDRATLDTVTKLKANKIIKRGSNGKDEFTDLGISFLKYFYDQE
ncbi:hypothetical protein [uncultured Algibacter sp.]|uniref:hypothetical protein n=1 Tax=uncultured Algibacter sp. TaxID=298659 RepID=UPI002619395C|nr:hypothetical protein [uncultured Algibacter sp.]